MTYDRDQYTKELKRQQREAQRRLRKAEQKVRALKFRMYFRLSMYFLIPISIVLVIIAIYFIPKNFMSLMLRYGSYIDLFLASIVGFNGLRARNGGMIAASGLLIIAASSGSYFDDQTTFIILILSNLFGLSQVLVSFMSTFNSD